MFSQTRGRVVATERTGPPKSGCVVDTAGWKRMLQAMRSDTMPQRLYPCAHAGWARIMRGPHVRQIDLEFACFILASFLLRPCGPAWSIRTWPQGQMALRAGLKTDEIRETFGPSNTAEDVQAWDSLDESFSGAAPSGSACKSDQTIQGARLPYRSLSELPRSSHPLFL